MGSIKRNNSRCVGLPVFAGLLLLAAAVTAEGRPTNCVAECPNRKGRSACLYRCWFGRRSLHLDLAGQEATQEVVLLTASEAECAAYCQKQARDLPGKYRACMRMCQSGPDGNANDDKIILHIDEEEEKKKQQEDTVVQLGSSDCDECGNTTDFMEYMSCLIRNHCV